MLGEVLETLDYLIGEPAHDGQHRVAECGEDLRRMSGMSTGLVLAAGDITYVMKSVLDAPVRARQRKRLRGTSLLRTVTGDRIHCLYDFLAMHDPFTRDAADLPHPRPVGCQVSAERGRGLDPPGFDPAVDLLDGLGPPEVRRRRPCR